MMFTVVASSSPPWAAGSTFNPLWRAAELTRRGLSVELLVPWFPERLRVAVPPFYAHHRDRRDLLGAVRRALGDHADWRRLRVKTYPARWLGVFNSPFPADDVLAHVSPRTDVLVLEEPEHLFFAGRPRRRAQCLTIGILHTNMGAYLRLRPTEAERRLAGAWERRCDGVCRATCDRVIALSPAVAHLTPCDVLAVNGVPEVYFEVPDWGGQSTSVLSYGRIEWGKGWSDLVQAAALRRVPVRAHGAGPERGQIQAYAARLGAQIEFNPPAPAPWMLLAEHGCFVNPAKTEVLASSSMEALAAGRWLIVPRRPENRLFQRFANCMTYEGVTDLARLLADARLRTPPRDPSVRDLSVAAATDRLLRYLDMDPGHEGAGCSGQTSVASAHLRPPTTAPR